jgi:hypothetical protein
VYRPRTPGYFSRDPAIRWALPDRVFFACGACHILAHAFLERHGRPEYEVLWIKPVPGHRIGNHIVVATGDWVFDFHGYSRRDAFFEHVWKRARHLWPGWDATLVPLPRDVLISEQRSRQFDGLWLAEPGQFLYDALPRAQAYLDRFPAPERVVMYGRA